MNRLKIIKNINSVAIGEITKLWEIQEFIKTLARHIDYKLQVSETSVKRVDELMDKLKACNNSGSVYLISTLCECDIPGNGQVLDIVNTLSFVTYDELNGRQIIKLSEFKHVRKNKYIRKMIKINTIRYWKDKDVKIRALAKFKKKNLKNIINDPEYETINQMLIAIEESFLINDKIAEYNKSLETIIDKNPWAIKCKKILNELDCEFDRPIGMLEIELTGNNYVELMLNLHLDFVFLNTHKEVHENVNIIYDGCSTFADMSVSGINFIKDDTIRKYVKNICDATSKVGTFTGMFEYSKDHKYLLDNNEYPRMITIEEVLSRVDKQKFLLNENANDIFGNLYKLLCILVMHNILKKDV